MSNSLETLTMELGQAISPRSAALQTPESTKTLINRLGWELPPGVDDIGLIGLPIDVVLAKLRIVIESTPEERDNLLLMAGRIADLALAISDLIEQAVTIATNLPTTLADFGDYVARSRIDQELVRRLLDHLLINYVSQRSPVVFAFLRVLTIFDITHFDPDPATFQTEHVRSIVQYDRVGTLLNDPTQLFQTGYGWGTANFRADALLINFALLLQLVGGITQIRPMSRKVEEVPLGRPVLEADTDPATRATINLFRDIGVFGGAEIGLAAYEIRPSSPGAADAGLGLMPIVRVTSQLALPLLEHVSLELDAGFDLSDGLNLIIRPGQDPVIQSGMFAGHTDVPGAGRIGAGLHFDWNDAPKVLLTFPGGLQIQVYEVRFISGVERLSSGEFDVYIELSIPRLQIIPAWRRLTPSCNRRLRSISWAGMSRLRSDGRSHEDYTLKAAARLS